MANTYNDNQTKYITHEYKGELITDTFKGWGKRTKRDPAAIRALYNKVKKGHSKCTIAQALGIDEIKQVTVKVQVDRKAKTDKQKEQEFFDIRKDFLRRALL